MWIIQVYYLDHIHHIHASKHINQLCYNVTFRQAHPQVFDLFQHFKHAPFNLRHVSTGFSINTAKPTSTGWLVFPTIGMRSSSAYTMRSTNELTPPRNSTIITFLINGSVVDPVGSRLLLLPTHGRIIFHHSTLNVKVIHIRWSGRIRWTCQVGTVLPAQHKMGYSHLLSWDHDPL